jgi:hypothetical protein
MADNVEITLKPVPVTPDSTPSIDYDSLSEDQKLIANKIFDEAERQGVDPDLMLSLAHIENRFNTGASPKGALGPMQLMPGTAEELKVDPNNIDQNIYGGVTYFKRMLDKYKDPYVAGIAYNAGPGVADKFLETDDISVIPTETLNYVDQLDRLYKPKGADVDADNVPVIEPLPEEKAAFERDAMAEAAGAGAGATAGLASGAYTEAKIKQAEAGEKAAQRQAASAEKRIAAGETRVAAKEGEHTGRLKIQTTAAESSVKEAARLRDAQLASEKRLAKATDNARRYGVLEEVVKTTPGGVTQQGGLGSGAMRHANVMGEVHEANVVRKGTETAGPGYSQKSRLIVPDKYAGASVYNPEQIAAQKELAAAEAEHQRLIKAADKAESVAQKEADRLRNLTERGPSGKTAAQTSLDIAKEDYAKASAKKAPGVGTNIVRYLSKIPGMSMLPGAASGLDLVEAGERFKQGDYPGAAISGVGALGGAMSMIPPIGPVGAGLKVIGGLTSLAAPALNYYRDSREPEQTPGYAAGGKVVTILADKANKGLKKLSEVLGEHEAKTVGITQADRQKVGGGYLGGPGFSGLQHVDPAYGDVGAVWAVKTPGVAKTLINSAKRGSEGQTIFIPMLGSPTQHKSGQMVFDNIINDFRKSARQGNLDPELLDMMNLRLINTVDKKGNPLFPQNFDITSRKFNNAIDTFDKRAAVADVIGGIGVGGKKSQIIDYDKLIARTTDPDLIDAPTGSLGNRMFTLSGEMLERPDLHPAFPTILTGEDLGVYFKPAPREIVLNDFIKSFTEAKGRAPGVMDFTRGYAPSNLITEEMLTNLQKAGYAEGGMVEGYDEGGEVSAAEYYGHRLDDSNSEMTQPVISDKANVVRNMIAQRDRLADKYLGGAGRLTSKGLENLRAALNSSPAFDESVLYPKSSNLDVGDFLIGEMPEAMYDYTTAGMPSAVLGNKWVPDSATGGMMHENPYGDIRALDFLNLVGVQTPIKSGLKYAAKAMKSKISKLPKK